MSAMDKTRSKTWRWLRWWVFLGVLVGAIAACAWLSTVHPKKDVLTFETNYPELNTNAHNTILIQGSLPVEIPMEFLAYYATSHPLPGETDYESCYRGIPLGPSIPLHLSERLNVTRKDSHYELQALLDKYQPGKCGWHLAMVTYRLLDGVEYKLHRFEAGWYGSAIAYLMDDDSTGAASTKSSYWRGRVDIWCRKQPGNESQFAESCGVLGGFLHDYSALVRVNERGDHAATTMTPSDPSAEINFHDLDALTRKDSN